MNDPALEVVLRRDRVIVLVALLTLASLASTYVWWLAGDMAMGGMDMSGFRMIPAGEGLMMPAADPWQPVEFIFVFVMWAIMMVGMMTPSVAPMVLLYARVGRQAATQGKAFANTAWFLSGYLIAWLVFSLCATTIQWVLERAALLNPMMESASSLFGGIVLFAAGVYQWTPLKDACLRQCQSPLQFIQRHGGFRRKATESVRLGARHGIYCVGCCWAIMTLLFVVGVMNVLWIAVFSILILMEKIAPVGRVISRLAGIVFVVAGVWLIASFTYSGITPLAGN